MKKTLYCLFTAVPLLALPLTAQAATSLDAATIFRYERRDVSNGSQATLLPATQFIGLDSSGLADGNLSLHLYGWGRVDLADKSYNGEQADGSLTYGYLQYRLKEGNAALRAGRFFVREGIINEQIDGVGMRSDLPYGFGLSAFGGATVHTRHLYNETSDGKGDAIYGGRATWRYKGLLEIGASGLYESAAPALSHHAGGNHRLIGGDIWFSPHRIFELIGHSSYNPETGRAAEHSYLLTVKPVQYLVLAAEFNEHHEQSFLYAWAMFSGAALDPGERSRSVGGSASYGINGNIDVDMDYKHYTRDFGNADRFGGDAKLSFLDNTARAGIGYHYLRAGQGFAIGSNPTASYHELRAYALHDTKTYFAAVDVIDYIFKNKVFNEPSAWEGTLSLGYHFTPALALSGDISYGRNPEFTEETKGLIRLTYNMTYEGKGGKK